MVPCSAKVAASPGEAVSAPDVVRYSVVVRLRAGGAARLRAALVLVLELALALAVAETMMLKGEPLESAASRVALLLLDVADEDEDTAAMDREGDIEGTLQR